MGGVAAVACAARIVWFDAKRSSLVIASVVDGTALPLRTIPVDEDPFGMNFDRSDVVVLPNGRIGLHVSSLLLSLDFPSSTPVPETDLGGGSLPGAQIAEFDGDGRWVRTVATCAAPCDVRLLAASDEGGLVLRTQLAWGGTRTELVSSDGSSHVLTEWGPPGAPFPSTPTPLGALTCDAAAFTQDGILCGGTAPPVERVGDVLVGDGNHYAPSLVAIGPEGVRWASVVASDAGTVTDVKVLASGAVVAIGRLGVVAPSGIGFVAVLDPGTGVVSWTRFFPLPLVRLAVAGDRIAVLARAPCARWIAVLAADGGVIGQRELPGTCATSSPAWQDDLAIVANEVLVAATVHSGSDDDVFLATISIGR